VVVEHLPKYQDRVYFLGRQGFANGDESRSRERLTILCHIHHGPFSLTALRLLVKDEFFANARTIGALNVLLTYPALVYKMPEQLNDPTCPESPL
jgi:hypothetical protein